MLGVVEGQLHKPCACPCSAGIALMMWNTFLVKRFSAATYLVDKVRSCLCVCVCARARARFLGPHLRHREVPGLGVQSEL